MAFGQQSGPPASHHQMRELQELLTEAGHEDFRDARGPMGFTQRQAGGKFTRDEADAFIAQLRDAADAANGPPDAGPSGRGGKAAPGGRAKAASGVPPEQLTASEKALRKLPSHRLAAELQRRGWVVMEP
jgi:hypothetical protein